MKNPFQDRKMIRTSEWVIPMCSLEVGNWVHEIRAHYEDATIQRLAEISSIPLAPSEAQNASKICPVNQQERQRLQIAMGQIMLREGEDTTHRWLVELMLLALGDYDWEMTGINTQEGALLTQG